MDAKALHLATQFHEIYERLAPSFGYETRTDTRQFDPKSKNGRLMVAVCGEVLASLASPKDSLTRKLLQEETERFLRLGCDGVMMVQMQDHIRALDAARRSERADAEYLDAELTEALAICRRQQARLDASIGAAVREFLKHCATTDGKMVNGNQLSEKAIALLGATNGR